MEIHNCAARHLALGCLAGFFLFPAVGSAQAQDECSDQLELCPNMKAYPAFDLDVVDNGEGGQDLIFSALTWNSGLGPLELFAGAGVQSQQPTQKVFQRIFKADDTDLTEVMAGEFEWHPAHAHFHFENYAEYILQPADAPGESSSTGSKTTFCVIDTNRIDHKLPGASKKAVYKWCNDDIQGMSVGWGDQYSSYLVGQEIDITGLEADIYTLTIKVDPQSQIRETDNSDNTSCILLNINPTAMSVSIEGDGNCITGGSGITLTASGYKVKGVHTVDLDWNGASWIDVQIIRNELLIDVINSAGEYTDSTGFKGPGSYHYQVCEEGGAPNCSNEAMVNF